MTEAPSRTSPAADGKPDPRRRARHQRPLALELKVHHRISSRHTSVGQESRHSSGLAHQVLARKHRQSLLRPQGEVKIQHALNPTSNDARGTHVLPIFCAAAPGQASRFDVRP